MALIPVGLRNAPLPTLFDFTDDRDRHEIFSDKKLSKFKIRKVNIYKFFTIAFIPIYPIWYISSEREMKDEKGKKVYRTRKISKFGKVMNRLFLIILYAILRAFFCIMQYFYTH